MSEPMFIMEDDGDIMVYDHPVMSGRHVGWGAISFPSENGMDIGGACLLGLRSRLDHTLYVLEETEYRFIDHVIDGDKVVERGISGFFNEMWLKYKVKRLFYCDDREFARRFRMSVMRNPMVNPRPEFRKLKSYNASDMLGMLQAGKLKFKSGGIVEDALHRYDMTGNSDVILDTLGVLCYGFSRIT